MNYETAALPNRKSGRERESAKLTLTKQQSERHKTLVLAGIEDESIGG